MSKYIIYGLVDPMTSQLRYVGKSERGLLRPTQHSMPSYLKKDQTHKGNWVRSLMVQGLGPLVVVVQELPDKDILPEAEVHWIAYFKAMGCPLTNHCRGGMGFTGPHTEKSKRKIGAFFKGRKRDPAVVERAARTRSRSFVDQYGTIYPSAVAASKVLGIHRSSISQVLSGKHRSAGGYVFRWPDAPRDFTVPPRKPDPRTRPIKDQHGIIYTSQAEAAKKLGLWQANISSVLHGKHHSTGGHTFQYLE